MNTLFDRYFLVLAGRLTKDHWGTVATPVHVGSGVITLGWPSEAPTRIARAPPGRGPDPFHEQEFVMNRAHGLLFTPLALAALTFASCSKDSKRKPTFPVTGKVVLPGGKPVEHATVVLHPVEDDRAGRCQAAREGRVRRVLHADHLRRQRRRPAGEYRVTVELWLTSGKGDEGPTSRLPAKYAKPGDVRLDGDRGRGPDRAEDRSNFSR